MANGLQVLRITDFQDENVWNLNQFYRLKSDHHARYLSVDLTSIELDANRNWPRILDEALRSLLPGSDCTLVLNTFGIGWFTRDEIMERIYQFCEGNVSLISVREDDDGLISTLHVRTRQRHLEMHNLSIGIVTNGASDEKLARILNSISELKAASNFEIETLVSGPEDYVIPLSQISKIDRYIPILEPRHLPAMITTKKNAIAEACSFENLILCHDRFVFDERIIETLRNFGGDFDVCALQACDQNGTQIPHWTAFNNDWRNGLELDPSSYDENIFYQGSLFLVKKSVLLKHPLNPLLYWGFGEDIEWSRRLNNSGLTPKLVNGNGIVSVGHRDGYFTWFLPVPRDVTKKYVPAEAESRKSTVGFARLGLVIKSDQLLSKRNALKHGLVFNDGVEYRKSELVFDSANAPVEFAIYLESLPVGGLRFRLGLEDSISPNQISGIRLNDYRCAPNEFSIQNNELSIALDKNRLEHAGSSAIRVKIFLENCSRFKITYFVFEKLGVEPITEKKVLGPNDFSKYLTSGWFDGGSDGIWSMGQVSYLTFPVPPTKREVSIFIEGNVLLNEESQQSVTVLCNERLVYDQKFDSNQYQEVKIELTKLVANEHNQIELRFEIGDPTRPSDLGLSRDSRDLGLELKKVYIEI